MATGIHFVEAYGLDVVTHTPISTRLSKSVHTIALKVYEHTDNTVPLCMQLALVVAMVTGIHFVEAYGLNPVIYSSHLKLHPLLVLTVLVFAEHSVGIWGLLLAGGTLPHIF